MEKWVGLCVYITLHSTPVLYAWFDSMCEVVPMCRNSSLSSLEVGMTSGMKTESRLHSFLIRYLTNHLFLAITYCLSSDMQGFQY